jgi:hypothetical protein
MGTGALAWLPGGLPQNPPPDNLTATASGHNAVSGGTAS